MSIKNKRFTLKDIAQDLGVSRATVSNAFNRPELLAQAQRERILSHAHSLGYFGPDPMARAMRRKDIREVAVVFHHDLSYAFQDAQSVQFLRGVASELDSRSLVLQLIPQMGRNAGVPAAFQTTADAIIVHADVPSELQPQLRGMQKPVVLIDTLVDGIRSIGIDDVAGARLAMGYALSKKPARVLALCLPVVESERRKITADPFSFRSPVVSGARLSGYLQALNDANFDQQHVDWLEVDSADPESVSRLILERIKHEGSADLAIVCMSDRIALAVQQVLHIGRYTPPCALVGFDDIPEAASLGLTTVRQDSYAKGVSAVKMLFDQMSSQTMPVQLVVRTT